MRVLSRFLHHAKVLLRGACTVVILNKFLCIRERRRRQATFNYKTSHVAAEHAPRGRGSLQESHDTHTQAHTHAHTHTRTHAHTHTRRNPASKECDSESPLIWISQNFLSLSPRSPHSPPPCNGTILPQLSISISISLSLSLSLPPPPSLSLSLIILPH